MPEKHAVLSASSAHRWLECPPSAKLNAAAQDTPSEYAAQGTDAHTLCEYKVRHYLGEKAEDPTPKLHYFDDEMADCTDSYLEYVIQQLEAAKEHSPDPLVLVEQRLDFSEYVPEGFGTGDCIIVSDDVLTVIDFKYGAGVEVSAETNPQMMCYALGALTLFDGLYDIKDITMTIFQPRRDNISTCTASKQELLDWAENTLKPIAELAAKGEGDLKAGEHCRFCRVKATCRKRAEYNLTLAKYDFEMPAMLEDAEVEAILAKADEFAAWIADIKDYALQEAVKGKQWSAWKLVEGRSVRKYTDESKVAEAVREAGFDPYEQKLLGITAMTKLLGRTKFEKLLGGLTEKPKGKPTLVPITDKRAAINSAADDFKEEN